jgi:hypothetical protein
MCLDWLSPILTTLFAVLSLYNAEWGGKMTNGCEWGGRGSRGLFRHSSGHAEDNEKVSLINSENVLLMKWLSLFPLVTHAGPDSLCITVYGHTHCGMIPLISIIFDPLFAFLLFRSLCCGGASYATFLRNQRYQWPYFELHVRNQYMRRPVIGSRIVWKINTSPSLTPFVPATCVTHTKSIFSNDS